jgi:hypothetical protein
MTTPRKFYFQITSASVIESITAHTMAEAKQIARAVWLVAVVLTDGMAKP